MASADPVAEEAFATQFRGRILALARARGCDSETAKDITHETLLSVLCALRNGRLRDHRLLARFVAGTARNLVNNHFRLRRSDVPHDLAPPATQPDAPGELIAAENAALVRQALEQLRQDDRQLMQMIFEQDLTTAVIARQLGTTVDAIRQRKHRALERLREALEEMSRVTPQRHRETDGLR
jgi:RNA polymerase sigma-70 factor (ECF subfamily)